jgi:hypothetical protein
MKRSSEMASSTDGSTMARVTRRALRVEWRVYLAVAEIFIGGLLQMPTIARWLAMPAVAAGGRELTEAMADHVLRDIDRDVLLAVVDGHRVADEVGEDDARALPGLDDLALVAPVHLLDPAEEPGLDERALLHGS